MSRTVRQVIPKVSAIYGNGFIKINKLYNAPASLFKYTSVDHGIFLGSSEIHNAAAALEGSAVNDQSCFCADEENASAAIVDDLSGSIFTAVRDG